MGLDTDSLSVHCLHMHSLCLPLMYICVQLWERVLASSGLSPLDEHTASGTAGPLHLQVGYRPKHVCQHVLPCDDAKAHQAPKAFSFGCVSVSPCQSVHLYVCLCECVFVCVCVIVYFCLWGGCVCVCTCMCTCVSAGYNKKVRKDRQNMLVDTDRLYVDTDRLYVARVTK